MTSNPNFLVTRVCLVALLTSLCGVGIAGAQTVSKAFVRFETASGQSIPGDATEPGFEDWICVHPFGQNLSLEGDPDRPVREPRVDCFSFLKQADPATPTLQLKLLKGELISRMQLRLRTSTFGGADEQPVTIEFTDVTLCAVESVGAEVRTSTVVNELVTIQFKTISWVYHTGGPAGRTSGWVYDLLYGTTDPDRDTDRDGLRNDVDPDDDNDGIPDEAEIMMRMSPIQTNNGDSDGDGSTDYEEYLAGSGVFDPASRFGVERVTLDVKRDPAVASITFPTIGGREYRVFVSNTMEDPVSKWTEVDAFVTEEDEAPRLAEVEIAVGSVARLSTLVFRVAVELP